jgi:hypoxanthine-DNA glycosylase
MEVADKTIEIGFPPVLGDNPKVLVLGTMPSVKSLQEQQYYGHPRNAFWWIMSQICGFSPELPYEDRLTKVKGFGVAIWDVAYSCHRPGSLDSNIDQATLKANDIVELLRKNPDIGAIAFNGQASAKLFKKFIGDIDLNLSFLNLPSTSPANASMKKEDKLEKWNVLLDYLCSDRN